MTSWRLTPKAFGDEFLLGHLVVHEDHVGIAAPRHVQRLAGAQGDHAHLDAAGLFLKAGSRWPNRPDCSVEVVQQWRSLGKLALHTSHFRQVQFHTFIHIQGDPDGQAHV
jgi:hypothetical protein